MECPKCHKTTTDEAIMCSECGAFLRQHSSKATQSVATQKTYRTLTVLFGPAALLLIVLSLARMIGVSSGSALIPALTFLAPVVGVVSMASTSMSSGFLKLASVVLYYLIMLIPMFVLGLMFGCGVLKMFCW